MMFFTDITRCCIYLVALIVIGSDFRHFIDPEGSDRIESILNWIIIIGFV